MNVLVIDGQGGGLGRQLVAALSAQCPDIRLVAVGTNSVAAQAMHKAGAQRAATGENAVVVNCRNADIIVGPIGIVIADALLGEITPAMATAVCQSSATRVLIPVNHCENYIVGVPDQPIGSLVSAAVQKVKVPLCRGRVLKNKIKRHRTGHGLSGVVFVQNIGYFRCRAAICAAVGGISPCAVFSSWLRRRSRSVSRCETMSGRSC